jgi:AcrR family transcriptional regulator
MRQESIAEPKSVVPPPQSAKGAASREAILQAAMQVIGREGLSGASLGVVAREAGTSKPAVLYHFGSRNGLLQEVTARTMKVVEDIIVDAARAPGSISDQIRYALQRVFDPGNRSLLAVVHELSGLGRRDASVGEHVWKVCEEAAKIAVAFMPKTVRATGQSDEFVARAALMAALGPIEAWLGSGEEDPAPYFESAIYALQAIVLWDGDTHGL